MAVTDDIFFDNKIFDMQRWPHLDQRNNVLYAGVVQAVSPINRANGTLHVKVPHLLSVLKCDASGAYSSYFTGQTREYYEGDHVLIAFVNGKSERPVVIASIPHHPSEWELGSGMVPKHDEVVRHENSRVKHPSATPQTVIPGAINNNYQVSGNVHRYRFDPYKTFHTNYIPASGDWVDTFANEFHYPGHTFMTKATEVQQIVRVPVEATDPVLNPFIEAEEKIKLLEVHPLIDHALILQDGSYIWGGDLMLERDQMLEQSKELFPVKTPEEVLAEAQEESDVAKFLRACLNNNVIDQAGAGFLQIIGDLFNLSNPLVQAALGALNSVLPDFLQVGVDGDGNISVGPLAINPQTGEVGFNGQVFGPLVDKALADINGVLPPFLGVNITRDAIGMGGDFIPLSQIGSMQPGQTMALGPLDVIKDADGNTTVALGGNVVTNITQLVTGQVSGVLAQPLAELNRQLPPGMNVGVTFGPDGLPIVQAGPLKLDFGNPAEMLSFNAADLMHMLSSQLLNFMNSILRQLPKPFQMLAQALWEELGIGDLFMGLLGSMGLPFEPQVIKSTTYTQCAPATDGTVLKAFAATNTGPPPPVEAMPYIVPNEAIPQFTFD